MENLRSIVAEHPFCKELEPAYVDLLTGCASNVRFEAGQRLFREGGEANEFFLIREGAVSLETVAPQGGKITVETVSEGEVLGWAWLVPSYRWHFTASAAGPVRAIRDGRKMPTYEVPKEPLTLVMNCSGGRLTLLGSAWRRHAPSARFVFGGSTEVKPRVPLMSFGSGAAKVLAKALPRRSMLTATRYCDATPGND